MASLRVKRSLWSHKNRVFRVERRDGGGIVVVDCIDKFFSERIKLLDYLWIHVSFCWAKTGTAKPIASPTRVSVFSLFAPGGLGWSVVEGVSAGFAASPGAKGSMPSVEDLWATRPIGGRFQCQRETILHLASR